MRHASLLTYGPDHSDGRAPVLVHTQLHTGLQPALGDLLPQVEGGLADVDHLVISVLLDDRAELLNELHLLRLKVSVLSKGFPVSVIWAFVLDSEPDVVLPKSVGTKGLQVITLPNQRASLLEVHAGYILQGGGVHKPGDLFLIQHLLLTRSFLVKD